MPYDLSKLKLPPAKGQPAPQSGNSNASSAPASSTTGYNLAVFDLPESVEIPKDGEENETIEIRNFGRHVRARVEDALRVSPESAVTALHWQIGTAKGASLMDDATMKRFEHLGSGFSQAKDRKAYFQKSIVPFLNGLTAGKRRKV